MKGLKGDVPQEGHLVVIAGEGKGYAIKPGTRMMIIEDPNRVDRAIPVFLAKVSRDKIHFRCYCGKPECTRVLEYNLTVKGRHPYDTVVEPSSPTEG